MPKKTFRLICIFFSLAILAMLYFLIYQGVMGNKLQQYLLSITKCYYLSEIRCQEHPYCRSIYKSTAESIDYTGCQYLSQSDKNYLSAAQRSCQQTGGRWQETKFGDYCNCVISAQGPTYKPGLGCVK